MPRGLYDNVEVVCLGEAHTGLDVCGGSGIDGVEGHVSLAADGGVVEAEGWRGGKIVLLPVDLEHVARDGVSEDGVCPLGIGTSSRETVAELHRGHDMDQAAMHHHIEHCELHRTREQRIAGLQAALWQHVTCGNHAQNRNIKSKNAMPGTHRSRMRRAHSLVMDDLTAHDFPESRKDQVEVFISHYRIKLADKKKVLRWPHVDKRQVTRSASSGKVSSGSSPSAILSAHCTRC